MGTTSKFNKSRIYVHPTAVVEENVKIGEGTRIWHFAHVREGAEIGKNCNIGKGVYIDCDVKIGNNVKIQNFVSLYRGVIVDDDVFIGPHVVSTNDKYPRAFNKEWRIIPTRIKKGASIGAGSVLVCGVEIGSYSMVGAGSVVTKNIPANGLVIGNPARLVGYVCRLGHPLKKLVSENKFEKNFFCEECNELVKIKKSGD